MQLKPFPVIASWALKHDNLRSDAAAVKKFGSQGEAMVYLQDNVAEGYYYVFDDCKSGDVSAYGKVGRKSF